MAIEITEQEIKQMGIYLLGLREKERELLDQLEETRQLIARQEGGIQFARAKLEQANGANKSPAAA